jgi:hypothetical protein
MTIVACNKCSSTWDAEKQSLCPHCEANSWRNNPNFLPPKHDPAFIASAYPSYRSVVNPNFTSHLDYIANSGTAVLNINHNTYNKVVTLPPGTLAGLGIPSGSPNPASSLDSYVIADSMHNPHIFAEHEAKILHNLGQGKLQLLSKCSVAGCNNKSVPGDTKCVKHISPPLAK